MKINKQNIEKILNNRSLRIKVAKESFEWFLLIYLNHHFSYGFAPYHREIMEIIQNPDIDRAYIAAFRSSGKTTLIAHAGVLWSIFGKPQKKYVVMLGLTKSQIEEHFNNIRKELETNQLLINDFGKSRTPLSIWKSDAIEIPTLSAKIVARSRGESIRGAKEVSERPDLIICDDLDDISSAKSLNSRNALMDWYSSEVLTLGFDDLKILVAGNIVHPDCFLVRMEELVKGKQEIGIYLKIPFFDELGNPVWPARFPDQESVSKLRSSIIDPRVWKREYELIPVTLMDQLIKNEDIHYYENLPNVGEMSYKYTLISVDPAISEKTTADNTAIVMADIYRKDENNRIFIQPQYINKKMPTEELLDKVEFLYRHNIGKNPIVLIENTAFQEIIAKQLEGRMLKVERVDPQGVGKIDRFMSVSNLIKSGVVRFDKSFGGDLKEQILYCGMTKHDDLLDAFVYILQYVIENRKKGDCGIISVPFRRPKIIPDDPPHWRIQFNY